MEYFGMSDGHLKDTMTWIAIQLLSGKYNLAYGGDLRTHGFSELLFELVLRYTPREDYNHIVRVTNHLAWPVHIGMPLDKIDTIASDLEGAAELVLLNLDGNPMSFATRRDIPSKSPSEEEWSSGLTAMRQFQTSFADARILLGGQVSNYKGCMPGVAEEALISLRAGQPLFLIGRFGGCTRDVAEVLGLIKPWERSRNDWAGREEFLQWTGHDLNNGLTLEENEFLAATPFREQSVLLVLQGLHRLRNGYMPDLLTETGKHAQSIH